MNTSEVNDTRLQNETSEGEISEGLQEAFREIWVAGISISTVALAIQLMLLILIPNVRKVRLLILTQMTTARYLHVVLEYVINYTFAMHPILVNIVFSVYFQADLVLICWMSVFTGNLFYKVVIVFPRRKFYFKITSILIWILTIPFGIVSVTDLNTDNVYNAYAIIKFIVLSVNACLIFWILLTAVMYRYRNESNKIKDVIKTCVVAFIVVTVTSVQVLITDIQSFLNAGGKLPMFIFSVINSFQAVVMTILFCMLARSACENRVLQKVNTNLKRLVGKTNCVQSPKKV